MQKLVNKHYKKASGMPSTLFAVEVTMYVTVLEMFTHARAWFKERFYYQRARNSLTPLACLPPQPVRGEISRPLRYY